MTAERLSSLMHGAAKQEVARLIANARIQQPTLEPKLLRQVVQGLVMTMTKLVLAGEFVEKGL